jgi:hypothetical protein
MRRPVDLGTNDSTLSIRHILRIPADLSKESIEQGNLTLSIGKFPKDTESFTYIDNPDFLLELAK